MLYKDVSFISLQLREKAQKLIDYAVKHEEAIEVIVNNLASAFVCTRCTRCTSCV